MPVSIPDGRIRTSAPSPEAIRLICHALWIEPDRSRETPSTEIRRNGALPRLESSRRRHAASVRRRPRLERPGDAFLPPSTAAMASARLVAGIPPGRRSGALGLTRFWTTPDFARLATHEFVRMWPNQRYAVCIWMLSTSPGTTEGSADVDRAFETVVCLGDAPYGAAV